MKVFRTLIKIMCVILVVSLTLTAIFFRKNGVDIVSVKSDDDIRAESVYVDASDRQYQRIAESGYLRLYFNKKTTAIIIKDMAGNKKWYSLPNGSNGDMVSLTVSAADGNHILNSQSNSVAFFSFDYEISTDGVRVRYILADDSTTAKKQKFMKKLNLKRKTLKKLIPSRKILNYQKKQILLSLIRQKILTFQHILNHILIL